MTRLNRESFWGRRQQMRSNYEFDIAYNSYCRSCGEEERPQALRLRPVLAKATPRTLGKQFVGDVKEMADYRVEDMLFS